MYDEIFSVTETAPVSLHCVFFILFYLNNKFSNDSHPSWCPSILQWLMGDDHWVLNGYLVDGNDSNCDPVVLETMRLMFRSWATYVFQQSRPDCWVLNAYLVDGNYLNTLEQREEVFLDITGSSGCSEREWVYDKLYCLKYTSGEVFRSFFFWSNRKKTRCRARFHDLCLDEREWKNYWQSFKWV